MSQKTEERGDDMVAIRGLFIIVARKVVSVLFMRDARCTQKTKRYGKGAVFFWRIVEKDTKQNDGLPYYLRNGMFSSDAYR